MKRIDMFCYRHPNFGLHNLMLFITIGSAAVWIFANMDHTGQFVRYLMFDPALILRGQIWRLVTFIFIPQVFSIWAIITFYFYYWIGGILEQHWGTPRFNIFILTGVLLTAIYGFIIYFVTGQSIPVGSSYIYLSMFFSFATLFPDTQVLFMFIIPLKIKWLAYVDAAFFVISIATTPFPYNLLPVVAILNYLLFFGSDLAELIRPVKARNSKTAVNFKKEKSRIRYEEKNKSYNYKCSVCGKTDAEYPNMEFRFCSRCAGYHCFCSEHINSHVHFTE